MVGKYGTLLWFWGILLAISLVVLTIGLRQASQSLEVGLPPLTLPIQPESSDDKPSTGLETGEANASWTLGLSVVTAVISAAGFVGTTYFALRNDRRQSALHTLQVENLRAEIQLQALEIERLRGELSAPKKKN